MKRALGILALGVVMPMVGAAGSSPARELPAGSWQVAAQCCKSWSYGICAAWAACTPATGAVRGERSEKYVPADRSEKDVPRERSEKATPRNNPNR
jgi:hypothetical protein